MPTALEEALQASMKGYENSKMPSYITAADTVNEANGNGSFIDSVFDTVESIPKFIAVSLISGANQLYNAPADIGNLFGADLERSDTYDVISDFDENLGNYYLENKDAADMVGFLASSLVPGTAGVKALKAGQGALRGAINAGKFSPQMGKALGLLTPAVKDAAVKGALKEVLTNSSAATLLSRNSMQALAAGAGQSFLEGLAFETAVAATMFNSPILENQDLGDLTSNILLNAGIYTAFATTVDAVKLSYSLKNTADAAAREARPWTFIPDHPSASPTHQKLALDFQEIHDIPRAFPEGDALLAGQKEFLTNAANSKVAKLENRLRQNFTEISGGDSDLGQDLFAAFKGDNILNKQGGVIGLVEAKRVTGTSPVLKQHARKVAEDYPRYKELQKKITKDFSKITLDEMDEYTELSLKIADENPYQKSWVRLSGEDAGIAYSEKPAILDLVDTITKKEEIKISYNGVTAGKKKYPFNADWNRGKMRNGKEATYKWDMANTDPLKAQARYFWAQNLDVVATAEKKFRVDVDDFPLMEKVYSDITNNKYTMDAIKFTDKKGVEQVIDKDLLQYIGERKVAMAVRLANRKHPMMQEEIAAVVNVKSGALDGMLNKTASGNYDIKDIFALQHNREMYNKTLLDKGLLKATDPAVPMHKIPRTVELTYDTSGLAGVNGHVAENMVIIKEQQRLYQEGTRRAASAPLGEYANQLVDFGSKEVYDGAVPSGAGADMLTAASQNYGSLASFMQRVGSVTTRAIEHNKNKLSESLQPYLYKLSNNQEAAIEWSVLNQKLRSTGIPYGLNEAGDALEPLALIKYRKLAAEAAEKGLPAPKVPNLEVPKGMERIGINNGATKDLVKMHIETNGKRTTDLAGIRSAQGTRFGRDPEAFYPIPTDPRNYPYYATVIDDSITGGGQHTTLYAATEADLKAQIAAMKQHQHFRILTKAESEEYYQSIGKWAYEKTTTNNYMDVAKARSGASSPALPATDPKKIIEDTLNWHLDRESGLVRESVSAYYEVQFRELQSLGKDFVNASTSTFGGGSAISKFAQRQRGIKNPYQDYIDTALAVPKKSTYPWWVNVNTMADEAFSKVMRTAAELGERAKTPEEIAEVNRLLEKAGYSGAKYTPDMEIFANHSADRNLLSKVVQNANSMLATVVLRWDHINSVVNAVSANVLLGAETKAVLRAIERGDKNAVGALADLTRVRVPGTRHQITTAQKMIANSMKKFHALDPASTPDFEFYRKNGFMTRISDQYRDALNDITFGANESVTSWNSRINATRKKLQAAGNIGEKWTGNKLAEEFNRFVAADVMKQMTDVAVSRGLMNAKEQLAYINTFVTRTQGNYVASQRPLLFQGAVGQAIGLFQTYQFNLIQQLLRHVGEGHSKDALTLLGLQGTIHGMNGLPAFQAINQHIVGTYSGNTEHRDIYSTTYGIAGKEAGDWLMYGAASNALGLLHPDLKWSLYTRGDINPRHVTVIPTNPADVPIYAATAKFMGNLFETVSKASTEGADITSVLLQGLEHNGISRPLAGLAQTLEATTNPELASYSTSGRGNVIAANDLVSLANLGRVLGSKPLDEAIVRDAMFRSKAYSLKDNARKQALGEVIKSTLIGGNEPSLEQMEQFSYKAAKLGMGQKDFNKWVTQLYKTANQSQANKLQQDLDSPYVKQMQVIMGGEEVRDFTP